jgi:hypothetical protein
MFRFLTVKKNNIGKFRRKSNEEKMYSQIRECTFKYCILKNAITPEYM